MEASRTLVRAVAVLVALLIAGCTLARQEKIRTGSVRPHKAAAAAPETPSLAAFEATDLSTGLKCIGSYNPLENVATFTAAVACEDGRTGKVTAARSHDLSGTGTLKLAGGTTGSVMLSRLVADEAPPSARNQLPAPDPSLYTQ